MNDKKTANRHPEKLLDSIAARIRNTPVPDYPGPPILPGSAGRTPSFPRATVVAVGFCLILLCVAVITEMTRNRPKENSHGSDHVVESGTMDDREITDPIGGSNVIAGPIRVTSINPTPEFDRMTDELNRLSNRLDELEIQAAVLEVQSDVAFSLVKYTPHKYAAR